jgi:hypothetical protein
MMLRPNPEPSFKLWLVGSDGQKELLSSSSSSSPSSPALSAFELAKDDHGKNFMCESVQVSTLLNNTLLLLCNLLRDHGTCVYPSTA